LKQVGEALKNVTSGEKTLTRDFGGVIRFIPFVLAVALSLFQLYTSVFGVYKTAIVHRSVHLVLVLTLFFIICPMFKGKNKSRVVAILDSILAGISIIAVGYVVLFYEVISERVGNLNRLDLTLGLLIIILVLEATRRINKAFFILALISIAYSLFGNYLPGIFSHPGVDLERLIYLTSFSSEGIFGEALGVSSTYLFLFILFGVFLESTGVGNFFIRMALSLVGRFTGGPAKTAVIASGLIGSVIGSSIANTVTVGSFTIPLMKKTGYRAHVAGAVEAVSSSGGQFLPPVMGAGAFIMAEITGIPYGQVALAALLPAVLYFISVWAIVHFEAEKFGLKGLSDNEVPKVRDVLKSSYLALPLLILAYFLLIQGTTATKAGVIAIASALLVGHLGKDSRFHWKNFFGVLEKGARNALEIAVLCSGMGIVIGSIIYSGLAMRFTSIVLGFAGDNLFLVLFLVMIICLILGMGLPTPVAYMIMAMFAAPSLVEAGVPLMAAHLFIFYFAIKSGVTPPIAITAVVAAGIANANWLKTAFTAFQYSLAGFIIAYMFVYGPPLLMNGTPMEIVLAFITGTLGVIALSASTQGWLLLRAGWLERILLGLSALLLLKPGLLSDLIGLLGIALVMIWQLYIKKRGKRYNEQILEG